MQVSITGVAAKKLAKTHRQKVEKDATARAEKQSSSTNCTVSLNKSTEAVYNFNKADIISIEVIQVRPKA